VDEATRRLLEALDETPATVTALAGRLGRDEARVEDGLARLEEQGLAVDWGSRWATTWRAKLRLAPGFFRVWVPLSAGAGAAAAALVHAVHAPPGSPTWPTLGLALAAVLGVGVGGWAAARDGPSS